MAKIYPYSQYVRKVICTDCGCIIEKTINYKPPKIIVFGDVMNAEVRTLLFLTERKKDKKKHNME